MKECTAIICEFNPLHRGHVHILKSAAKYGNPVIAVMSGNFTQRSECALYDKYRRAAAAVACGADAVFELPFPWCSAGAEFFARGGVSLGVALGASRFVFGSECGDIELLEEAAKCAQSEDFRAFLRRSASSPNGIAASYNEAMERFGFRLGSNDRLGIHYISASRELGHAVEFVAVKRLEDRALWRSAGELRLMIASGDAKSSEKFIPPEARRYYGPCPDSDPEKLLELERMYFRMACVGNIPLAETFDGGGGIIERLVKAARESRFSSEFSSLAATKKYTSSRLRRAALFSMLGVQREMITGTPPAALLLAANSRGREYISEIRKEVDIPIITKPSAAAFQSSSDAERHAVSRRADELYTLCMTDGMPAGEFMRRSPLML